jgi:hypothetical protein
LRGDGATNTGAGGIGGVDTFQPDGSPGGNGSGNVTFGRGSAGLGGSAAGGAVRIIWGAGRSYPNNAADA